MRAWPGRRWGRAACRMLSTRRNYIPRCEGEVRSLRSVSSETVTDVPGCKPRCGKSRKGRSTSPGRPYECGALLQQARRAKRLRADLRNSPLRGI